LSELAAKIGFIYQVYAGITQAQQYDLPFA
jgi:hypothetical protein